MTAERDQLNRTADLNRRLENAAPCPKCEIWFVDYWAKVAEKQAAEAQRDAALSRVAALEAAAVAVVEHWDGYDESEWGPEDKKGVRLLKNLRSALAPRSERREGEPCAKCGGAGGWLALPDNWGNRAMQPCHACAPPAAPRSERREGEPANASDYDHRIHSCPDARVWAKFFMDCKREWGWEVDEEAMRGWFANAMMAMHDHIRASAPPADPKAPERGAGNSDLCPHCEKDEVIVTARYLTGSQMEKCRACGKEWLHGTQPAREKGER